MRSFPVPIKSPPNRWPLPEPPDLTGPDGKAWRMPLPAAYRGSAALALWAAEVPDKHIAWHSFGFSLIHLRPVEGLPAPVIHRPGATHEFVFAALNPQRPVVRGEVLPMLSPPTFVAQFPAADDEAAELLVEKFAIQTVLDGLLYPDTDFLSSWVQVWGGNCVKPGVLRDERRH